MTRDQFIAGVLAVSQRVKYYHTGGCGDPPQGACDCVGLIIGGIREAGGTYTGIHGSNWFARHYTANLRPLVRSQLLPGDLVYKAKMPGESGYKLPDRYASDPDKHDYCHIGMVVNAQPLSIIHCTSVDGGIAYDSKVGKWSYMGTYTGITDDADGGVDTMSKAMVTAPAGDTVNMRTHPSTDSAILTRLPVGTLVDVTAPGDTWSGIEHNGLHGWMMSRYLTPALPDQGEPDGSPETVSVPRDKLVTIYNWLGEVLTK